MLKLDEIRSYCYYSSSISKGRELYATRSFKDVQVEQDAIINSCVITAKVKGSDASWYNTRFEADPVLDEIIDYSCECVSYQQTECMCKHCVALALMFQTLQKGQTLTQASRTLPQQRPAHRFQRPSDSRISNLLTICAAGQVGLLPGSFNHEIKIEPIFSLDYHGSFFVELRIGKDRMYVVKDLGELFKAISLGKSIKYGKNLEFVHCREAFTEESLEWLDLLQDVSLVQDGDSSLSLSYRYYMYSSPPGRRISLMSYGVEKCLAKYLDAPVPIPGLDMNVVSGDPKLTFQMTAATDGAVINLVGVSFQPIFGSDHLYIRSAGQIWQCTKEFAAVVTPLLTTFGLGRTERTYSKNKDLFIAQNDFRPFCKSVLPAISPYLDVVTEGFTLEGYLPEAAQFKVYLTMADSEEDMTVDARCEAVYGEKVFDLMDMESEHLAYRDPTTENAMISLLAQYFSSDISVKPYNKCAGEENVIRLVRNGLPLLHQAAEVFVDEMLLGIRVRSSPKVSLGVSLESGLLQLNLSSDLDDPSEIAKILSAYRRKKKYYRLNSGELVALDSETFGMLDMLSDGLMIDPAKLADGQVSLPQYRAAFLNEIAKETAGCVEVRRNAAFRRMMADMHGYQNSEFDVPESVHAQLLGYQTDGFRWLSTLAQYGLGGILADEMGLGSAKRLHISVA